MFSKLMLFIEVLTSFINPSNLPSKLISKFFIVFVSIPASNRPTFIFIFGLITFLKSKSAVNL